MQKWSAIQQMDELKHGFRLVKVQNLPQYHGKGYYYIHEKHKTKFFAICNDDPNNTFSASFRTTCEDDTGSTHVLEHMTLHGSQKYPISDIFNELQKRSISYLLNAETSLDYTNYYFSSKSEKDYHNCMDVYLDAIFHPNLCLDNFLTECHHLEPYEEKGEIKVKHSGVVYSEMCGDLSQSMENFNENLRKEMMPDTPYKYIFGGDPIAIAKLSLDEIKRQHKRYYAPSNCYLFHYGNFNIEPILERINSYLEEIPKEEKRITFDDSLYLQKKFEQPKVLSIDGPLDPMTDIEEQYKAVVSWQIGTIYDIDLIFEMKFIMDLLTNSVASPLYQKLVQTQLGSSIESSRVFDSAINVTFDIYLEGLQKENIDEFYQIVDETMEYYSKNQFDKRYVEGSLNKIELYYREIDIYQGNSVFDRLLQHWIYGTDPFTAVDVIGILERIKQKMNNDPNYIQKLIKKYLVDNKSKVYMSATPKEDFIENMNKLRNSDLNKNISKEEMDKIIEEDKRVKELVTKEKPLYLLPSIKLSDCNPKHEPISYYKNGDIMCCPTFCNGLVYIKIRAEIPLDDKLAFDLPLLENVFGSVGCGDLDDLEFSILENLYTTGIEFELKSIAIDDPNKPIANMTTKTAFLPSKMDEAINLLRTLLLDPYLDNSEHINAQVNAILQEFSCLFTEDGDFGGYKAGAKVNRSGALNEIFKGITSFERLKEVKDDIIPIIKDVYKNVYRRSHFKCMITSEQENIDKVFPKISSLIKELNQNNEEEKCTNYDLLDEKLADFKKVNEDIYFEYDSMVNFCNSVCESFCYTNPKSGILLVLSNLLKNEFLHVSVREKLGAYGVYATNQLYSGLFRLESYRDTNSIGVLNAFKDALEQVANGNFTEEMIELAKINSISYIDYPISPQNKGNFIFNGITNDNIQDIRKHVFEATKEEIIEIAKELKDKKWSSVVQGNPSVSPIPDGFQVLSLN